MLTTHYIYDLNIFSPTFVVCGMLFSLLFDYQLSGDGFAPKYWFGFKFKYLLGANLFFVLGIISLLTFKEYANDMNKMLQGYELMVEKELGITKAPTKPQDPTQKDSVKKEKSVSDILSDPTK
jgi:hypothetical protein